MSDFVSEEEIEISVFGRLFSFKEKDGKETDKMLNDSMKVIDGNVSIDMGIQNNSYLACVTKAPYEGWETTKDKIGFLNTLKKSIRLDLLKQIKNYHNELSDTEKK